nr:Microsomal glutathione S-transferase 3 [Polyrhizophydium stewartii]
MTAPDFIRDRSLPFAVGVASTVFLTALSARVGRARAEAGVPYPYMYAERHDAEKDSAKHIFNCTQRAHQNTLEWYPSFLLLRWVFAEGYCTGDPAKRNRGVFGMLGLLALLGMSAKTAVAMIVA